MTIKELDAQSTARENVMAGKIKSLTTQIESDNSDFGQKFDSIAREIRYLVKERDANEETVEGLTDCVKDLPDMLGECIRKGHNMKRVRMSHSYGQRYTEVKCRNCEYKITRKANLWERLIVNIIEKTNFKGLSI